MTGDERGGSATSSSPPGGRSSLLRAVDLLVFAAWVAVTLAAVWHHEPCRDEAHKWLLARDVGSLREFLAMTRADSTPGLWVAMLLPFAKGGAPLWTAHLVSWLCAAAGAALLWFAAPLPRLLKALALFSYFLVFDVAVLSRYYPVMMLLCFACLALHPARWRHPLRYCLAILLLMNVSLPGAFIAAALAGLFLLEALRRRLPPRRVAPGALVLAAGALAVAAQLFLAPVPAVMDEVLATPPGLARFLGSLDGEYPWMRGRHLAAGAVVVPLLLLLAASLLMRPRALVLGLSACVPAAAVFWRIVSTRFVSCMVVGVLMALWLAALEPESPWRSATLRRAAAALARLRRAVPLLLALPLGLSVAFGADEIVKDIRMEFSGAPGAAAFLKAGGLDRRRIAVFPDYLGIPLLPYLEGRPVFFVGANRWGTHDIHDEGWMRGARTPLPEVLPRAFKAAAGESSFLLVLGFPVHFRDGACRQRYATDPARTWSLWGEVYHIYECRAG